MTRLGTLPIEIETGRWENKPRAERLCRLGCNEVGDVAHFMVRCAALSTERVPSLVRSAVTAGANSLPSYWRTTARKLERRWRERTHALRTAEAEPLHPADAQDDEFSKLLNGGVQQQKERLRTLRPEAFEQKRNASRTKKSAGRTRSAQGREETAESTTEGTA